MKLRPLSILICSVSIIPAQVSNRQMTLDVVVTDKSGKPVSGLVQQDFTLLDNKAPQTITSFRAVDGPATPGAPPVEIVLVIDAVNTDFSNVARERSEILKFLEQNGGELPRPTSLALFTDSGVKMGTASTQDGKSLASDLNGQILGLRTINRSQGIYGAGDRLDLSIRSLGQLAQYEATKPGRKLVIWISPGWPLLSGPRIELTATQQQQILRTVVMVSDGLRRADITLYSVDPLGTNDAAGFRTFYYKEFLKGVRKQNQAQFGDLALQVLAEQSGGRVLNSSNDIAGEIATAAADAHTFYVLTFDSDVADGPNDYHELDVKIDKPHLTAHTRTGYYAQP